MKKSSFRLLETEDKTTIVLFCRASRLRVATIHVKHGRDYDHVDFFGQQERYPSYHFPIDRPVKYIEWRVNNGLSKRALYRQTMIGYDKLTNPDKVMVRRQIGLVYGIDPIVPGGLTIAGLNQSYDSLTMKMEVNRIEIHGRIRYSYGREQLLFIPTNILAIKEHFREETEKVHKNKLWAMAHLLVKKQKEKQ